ncbi:hypothetical protein PUN28_002820 [Cardiocondyla obscurior]|uniref:Uncharacterized protein n=1 Tax=Cardiocondyla obscurior TaxID=286306 RepID=A0AAW2GWI8_9HYME
MHPGPRGVEIFGIPFSVSGWRSFIRSPSSTYNCDDLAPDPDKIIHEKFRRVTPAYAIVRFRALRRSYLRSLSLTTLDSV